jgi:hypothetical protein
MITYLELLQKIYEGRPPKRLIYDNTSWYWNGDTYVDKGDTVWLGDVIIRDCSDLALSKSKDIEVLPDVPGGNA